MENKIICFLIRYLEGEWEICTARTPTLKLLLSSQINI